ncbi:response regulator [Legionella yabuuchiae]|uniref:response regulator n=1 Tax=Legionella yabuuchiae TaxID=376727 RepID=UPI001F5F9361|nr:response regulator [Legionella yabuuchiae]
MWEEAKDKLYLQILNSVSDSVYWIDNLCNLKGYNLSFIKLLGIDPGSISELKGTPYDQMLKFTSWNKKSIESMRLDDMKVIFSKQEQMNVEESIVNGEGKTIYFCVRRVPLFDDYQEIKGLVVVLTDITEQMTLRKKVLQNEEIPTKKLPKKITHPNILLVEDDRVAQTVEKSLFSSIYCNVDVAATEDKVIELFKPGKYDMVLMDISLEETSGYMIAKKVRDMENKSNYHIPIIALTSHKAAVVKEDCKTYFMDGVLSKPISAKQAEQLIKRYIHREEIQVNGLEPTSEE